MSLPTILIIAADPDFGSRVMAHWPAGAVLPAFVILGDTRTPDGVIAACDIAICGPAPSGSLISVLHSLEAAGRPAICLAADAAAASALREKHRRAVILPDQEGALNNVVALAVELLRCADAAARAHRAEEALAEGNVHAALGRYMLEMRHGLNNALTSILGNSELLLLEREQLSDDIRDQLGTMHDMALRIHETLLRFTAMEQEMKLYSTSHHEIPIPPHTMLHATHTGTP